MNMFISIASFGLGFSTLLFIYNIINSWRGGPRAVSNPWRSLTLEWQVSSPPPVFNFDRLPDRRRRPLRVRCAWSGPRHLRSHPNAVAAASAGVTRAPSQ